MRFGSGFLLGLLLGLPAGALVVLFAFPTTPADQGKEMARQLEALTRKLEAANEDRQQLDRKLEQFQKLAEQMTASFTTLEGRFKALAEERQREASSHPVAPALPTATVPLPTPTAPAPPPPPPAAETAPAAPEPAAVEPPAAGAADVR